MPVASFELPPILFNLFLVRTAQVAHETLSETSGCLAL